MQALFIFEFLFKKNDFSIFSFNFLNFSIFFYFFSF